MIHQPGGYFIAPEGEERVGDVSNVVFSNGWVARDNGELWLSTDDNPATASMIASVPGWTDSCQWDKYSEQQSGTISLSAGGTYYIEALQKEGGGGDNLAVAWQGPGISQQVIAGSYLSPATGGHGLPIG